MQKLRGARRASGATQVAKAAALAAQQQVETQTALNQINHGAGPEEELDVVFGITSVQMANYAAGAFPGIEKRRAARVAAKQASKEGCSQYHGAGGGPTRSWWCRW